MANKNDSFILLTGLLIGATAGAAAGILLAPCAGKDTREKFRQGRESMRNRLRKQLECFSDLCCSAENEEINPVVKTSKSTGKSKPSKAKTSNIKKSNKGKGA